MMKLYSGDLSPYSARVRMQIYAKGLTDIVIERPADFGTPKFRERLPIGRIPVLDIDGDLMPEERETRRECVIVSAGDHQRAIMKMWEIIRDDQGRVTKLIEDKHNKGDFGGRMFNLMADDDD